MRKEERKQSERENEFSEKYNPINLESEYPGYEGDVKWALKSDSTEDEIRDEFPDVIEFYSPFVIITKEQGHTIDESNRRERALEEKERYHRFASIDSMDYEGELFTHFSLSPEEKYEKWIDNNLLKLRIAIAMSTCTELQRERLRKLGDGKTIMEIAREEGVTYKAVEKSIKSARKKFRRKF